MRIYIVCCLSVLGFLTLIFHLGEYNEQNPLNPRSFGLLIGTCRHICRNIMFIVTVLWLMCSVIIEHCTAGSCTAQSGVCIHLYIFFYIQIYAFRTQTRRFSCGVSEIQGFGARTFMFAMKEPFTF